jgi:UDP-glucose 4-epimerase
MKKKIIVVTGGAGFVGSNLIKKLLEFKNFEIISVDNYSSGKKKNHIKNSNVKYIKSDTIKIAKILENKKKKIIALFHFGEFARIYKSFSSYEKCFSSNINGTKSVFEFCLKNKIKLIYSATSASLGNNGNNQNLSPYSFTKSKNLELLENFKKWYNFKFEVIYFYNVYGPHQIETGDMATVIGIFEHQTKKNNPLTVVKPGTQTRRFTHINDTIKVCIEALKKNKCKHYSISSKENYSILQIAKFFGGPIKLLPERAGERYSSKVLRTNLSNKIINKFGNSSIKKYIHKFKKNI